VRTEAAAVLETALETWEPGNLETLN
jgi:hypothetical protein